MAYLLNKSFTSISSNSSKSSWSNIEQFSSTKDLELFISLIPFRRTSYQRNHENLFRDFAIVVERKTSQQKKQLQNHGHNPMHIRSSLFT